MEGKITIFVWYVFKIQSGDFTGDPMVKNLPANVGRGHRFDTLSGKIPHATGQQDLCATTIKPMSFPRTAMKTQHSLNK